MHFPAHTTASAPGTARRGLHAIEAHFGYLPDAAARMATSPQVLEGFQRLNALFGSTSLPPLARETVIMTVAVRNGCHVCVALHTERLHQLGADAGLIAALRAETPIDEPDLAAVRAFALAVMAHSGDVPADGRAAFAAAGWSAQAALEVVLGIATYTLSTFANRLTGATVDPELAARA
ncbi:carboxymuconolactone decarboxylase family protein [Catenuloplanes indicus]|uniref:AhpD family alkylhydroperoxidase n=1 Tax=Catenuloplanes indicus TaxID=137267 RepID=A0AAE3W7L1_9ACTN|nr:carboxymuconolactone decarboxylase family protein [Catenuloplanes indicus]MDQ0370805.1 AhpD family alkylhydroperoxidase [Catenuloplanes indicus]